MKVIGFCGFPGSGKSTAIEAISDLAKVIMMGDVIRNEVKNRKLALNDENLGTVARELRQLGGLNVIAEKCVEWIKELKNEIIIVDGLRSLNEVNVFRKYWKVPIIAIILNNKKRFIRLSKRRRSDDPLSIEEFKKRDEREIYFGLKEVVEKADYKIKNNSSIDELKKKTRKIFLEILQNY
jgi:dephospho-CoA kinase